MIGPTVLGINESQYITSKVLKSYLLLSASNSTTMSLSQEDNHGGKQISKNKNIHCNVVIFFYDDKINENNLHI